MRVTHIDTATVITAPSEPWSDALSRVDDLGFVFVDVHTDEGISGLGLAYSVGAGATAVHDLIASPLSDIYIGSDPHHHRTLWSRARHSLRRLGTSGAVPIAIAALDIAMWDLVAQHAGVPLCEALGGNSRPIATYGSGIDLPLDGEQFDAHIRRLVAAGYRTIKIKVGRSLSDDLRRLGQARDIVGDDVDLLLDANQAWRIDEAIRRLDAFAPFRPGWIEEPLGADDTAGLVSLRARTNVPIALGESLFHHGQFFDQLVLGTVDVVQPDVVRVGGVGPCLAIADTAAAAGRSFAPHFLKELSVHLLCAAENGRVLEDVIGGSLFELGLTVTPVPFDPATGCSEPPRLPGHGIVLDRNRLEDLRVR